mmetsp:Transcript_18622/g.47188  ORF Transcript_18622/g.47188 Transcript_18622/m.47188 type:complete len:296 (-) Transcript_18622:795-1682(-)
MLQASCYSKHECCGTQLQPAHTGPGLVSGWLGHQHPRHSYATLHQWPPLTTIGTATLTLLPPWSQNRQLHTFGAPPLLQAHAPGSKPKEARTRSGRPHSSCHTCWASRLVSKTLPLPTLLELLGQQPHLPVPASNCTLHALPHGLYGHAPNTTQHKHTLPPPLLSCPGIKHLAAMVVAKAARTRPQTRCLAVAWPAHTMVTARSWKEPKSAPLNGRQRRQRQQGRHGLPGRRGHHHGHHAQGQGRWAPARHGHHHRCGRRHPCRRGHRRGRQGHRQEQEHRRPYRPWLRQAPPAR